jgi:RNA polymerase sigma-70 factor, ECF subfamily
VVGIFRRWFTSNPAAIKLMRKNRSESYMGPQQIDLGKTADIGNRPIDAQMEDGLGKLTPFLRTFAVSLTHNRDMAADLAQETLTKAWRSRHSFIPGSNLKAWLFTILRNEFSSQQRRAWRQVAWDENLGNNIPGHTDGQYWAVELSDMAGAMQTLPNTQREALVLVGAAGFSYEEVAKHTKVAVGTVKSRVARGRQALKDILGGPKSLPMKSRLAQGDAINGILSQFREMIETNAGGGPTPARCTTSLAAPKQAYLNRLHSRFLARGASCRELSDAGRKRRDLRLKANSLSDLGANVGRVQGRWERHKGRAPDIALSAASA